MPRVRPLPVLYPCPGCPQWGDGARAAAGILERRGLAEVCELDEKGLVKAKARFPAVTVDACGAGCARAWLERHGAAPHRAYVLEALEDAKSAARRIAEDWG